MAERIAIGSDHGGFALKEKITKKLTAAGYKVDDKGTFSGEPCDYPRFGFEVARAVSLGKARKGIVICKTGIGMSVVANKMPGVRAGLCASVADAVSARQHNDTNVLVLAATKLAPSSAVKITLAWISEKALKGRHGRRVKQIKDMEKKLYKPSVMR